MVIIRGLPGAGKTHTAKELEKELRERGTKVAHFEADMFHMKYEESTKRLTYKYNPDLKVVAHRWCEAMIKDAMESGRTILVSNTFSQYQEMIPYFILARDFGYRVSVITCRGEYPNIHDVPEEAIQRMRERWED
jgi:predicted ABC-type ATPase